jgi:hypothetical protein
LLPIFLLSLALAGSAAGQAIQIVASEDVAPYSFLPNLPRFNNPTLYAFQEAEADTGVEHDFETYLWFDVELADIPPGEVLSQAFLLVTYAFDFTSFGETSSLPGTLECREVIGPWEHTSLTWLNRPPVDAPFDSIEDITEFGSLACDATSIVERWLYGIRPNEGFALTSPTPRVMGMHSIEASVDPVLMPTLALITEVPEPGFGASLAVGTVGLAQLSRRLRRRGRAGSFDVSR